MGILQEKGVSLKQGAQFQRPATSDQGRREPMDACPQPCHQSAEPRRPLCQTHQTQEPFWSQETMRLGEHLRDIGSRKDDRDVSRDKAIIGTKECIKRKGPIGFLYLHTTAKASAPGLR